MRKYACTPMLLLTVGSLLIFSCRKAANSANSISLVTESNKVSVGSSGESAYNLEVVLRGNGNENGHIQFRQDADPAKIITLATSLRHLLPNHEYQLQRAVDPANAVDGNCTSTSWLTLGLGLNPQTIMTNDKGDGEMELWRDVSAVPAGYRFDIHFQVIDAVDQSVALTSNCYQYTVR